MAHENSRQTLACEGERVYLSRMVPLRAPSPPVAEPRQETAEEARARLNVPLSANAAAALEAGLASARRGEIAPWDDFSAYAVEDEDDPK
jgi:hypothetical protein